MAEYGRENAGTVLMPPASFPAHRGPAQREERGLMAQNAGSSAERKQLAPQENFSKHSVRHTCELFNERFGTEIRVGQMRSANKNHKFGHAQRRGSLAIRAVGGGLAAAPPAAGAAQGRRGRVR